MNSMKMSVVLLSALALAAPGTSFAKDKNKDKNKDKGKSQSTEQHDDRGDKGHGGDGKVTLCHVPGGDQAKRHTITVGESALSAHMGHGDHKGACNANTPGPGNGDRFDRLDKNDDGVISASEWDGDRATFERLDRNDDRVISRREFGL